ncbi:unnamed protein product [Rotaria socialis]|uniref:Uncharacterized protein n=1 Tax=Rotaria socialis TaxID=392032 RepID=A0A818WGN9_9BILA|nr:unnamed protein product [Rotaria socialis]
MVHHHLSSALPLLTSSRDVINALDQVLKHKTSRNNSNNNNKNTSHNNDDGSDDDHDNYDDEDDDDYAPNQSIGGPSIKKLFTKQQESLNKGLSTTKDPQMPPKIVSFDTLDENGNKNTNIALILTTVFLLDDAVNYITSKSSQQSINIKKKSQSKNVSRIKQPKSIVSQQNNKRKRGTLQVIGLNTSDAELTLLFSVTRVQSHGYVQVVFNAVTKDLEELGYKIETKHPSQTSQQRSEKNETTYVDNYHA